MNAPETRFLVLEAPGEIRRTEPSAIYMWTSKKRLVVCKGEDTIDLDAADLRELVRFIDGCTIEEQLQ